MFVCVCAFVCKCLKDSRGIKACSCFESVLVLGKNSIHSWQLSHLCDLMYVMCVTYVICLSSGRLLPCSPAGLHRDLPALPDITALLGQLSITGLQACPFFLTVLYKSLDKDSELGEKLPGHLGKQFFSIFKCVCMCVSVHCVQVPSGARRGHRIHWRYKCL